MGSVLGHSPVSRPGSLPSVEDYEVQKSAHGLQNVLTHLVSFSLNLDLETCAEVRLNLIISCGLSEIFTVKLDSNEGHWGNQLK